jgi:hypothetical protein
VADAAPAGAQDAKQDFKLVNKTGYELKALYVAPSKSDDWQDDILGQDTLADGEGRQRPFQPQGPNLRVGFEGRLQRRRFERGVEQDRPLQSIEKITIHYNRKNDVTKATFD